MLGKLRRKPKSTQTPEDTDEVNGETSSPTDTDESTSQILGDINKLLNDDSTSSASPLPWLSDELDPPYPAPSDYFATTQIGELHSRTHR